MRYFYSGTGRAINLGGGDTHLVRVGAVRAHDGGRRARGGRLQLGAVGGEVARHVQRRRLAQPRARRLHAARALRAAPRPALAAFCRQQIPMTNKRIALHDLQFNYDTNKLQLIFLSMLNLIKSLFKKDIDII